MIISPTPLRDAAIIDLEKREDERGFFARAWCRQELEAAGIDSRVVQANIGFCRERGTLRGLHYQTGPAAEQKWIRCIRGAVYDVIIDLRRESPSYRQWYGAELTADNRRMLYVPKGFAHGYLSLEDNAEVYYLVSDVYSPGHEGGIRWDDPAFSIDWPIRNGLILSDKDRVWPDFDADTTTF